MEVTNWKYLVRNPTGAGIRSDPAGDGRFNSRRGGRKHDGVDFLCIPGQDVVSPIDGVIGRVSEPYKDGSYSGLEIDGPRISVILWYIRWHGIVRIGDIVKQGRVIAKADDVSRRYGTIGMLPHVHLKISKCDPLLLMQEEDKWQVS